MNRVRATACAMLLCLLTVPFFSFVPATAEAVPKEDPLARLERLSAEAAQRSSDALLVAQANELEMIEYRRGLMGRAGLQFYVVFFNDTGQPVDYFVTSGKCTSSSKRLLRSWQFQQGQVGVDSDGNAKYGDFVLPAASLDGTHGSSDGYVFCRTSDGKYKQWNGTYYVSEAPIEPTVKPLAIDASGKTQSQQ